MNKNKKDHQIHTPVLLNEVLSYLKPTKGEKLADMTAGYGGHAEAILERTLQTDGSVLVDRDKYAISMLAEKFGNRLKLLNTDFLSASQQMVQEDKKFDIIIADLGVSSAHLDIANRGFSFTFNGPLDMRMDQDQALSANDIVNAWPASDIEAILREYGEEPKAKNIAKYIEQNRPIVDTSSLEKVVAKAYRSKRKSKKNPATRTFQAIRIAVNNELEMLEQVLPIWEDLLRVNGRIAIITFHSLEDRIVKNYLKEKSQNKFDRTLSLLSKKAIKPTRDEIVKNPRARSAKLRVAVKIKKEGAF